MTMPEMPHAIDAVDGAVVVVFKVFFPGEMLSFSVKTNSFNTESAAWAPR